MTYFFRMSIANGVSIFWSVTVPVVITWPTYPHNRRLIHNTTTTILSCNALTGHSQSKVHSLITCEIPTFTNILINTPIFGTIWGMFQTILDLKCKSLAIGNSYSLSNRELNVLSFVPRSHPAFHHLLYCKNQVMHFTMLPVRGPLRTSKSVFPVDMNLQCTAFWRQNIHT